MKNLVYVDEVRLGQVVSNLISNAVKFTDFGFVHLDILVEENFGDANFVFKIEDTGRGIDDEAFSDIFTPFSQVKNQKNVDQRGTGLGLSISKKIVDAMGGVIYVESELGKGSKFTFEVNLKLGGKIREDLSEVTENESQKNSVKNARILIAEDNLTNQIVISKFIQKWDLIQNAPIMVKSAIEMLDEEKFDLVLMDCQMPEVDGYSATRIIRGSRKKYKNIPIIALTANAVKGDDEKCFQCGMNDYLTKPISRNYLRKK